MRIVPAIGLKTVKIDPGQMEQVIVNIAMNAADAMPNGGKFTLETANVTLDEDYVRPFPGLKPGDYVMLAITDTGIGMSEEVKARVFEPFFSTKGVGQGTGLGLATCYGILKQSDGHINVYSETARGTTFKIYLPQVEQPAKSSAAANQIARPAARHGNHPAGRGRSLPAGNVGYPVKRLGYTVLTAVNGIEALNLKQQRDIGHIDLLFTDVVMPHMSGKELSGPHPGDLSPHQDSFHLRLYGKCHCPSGHVERRRGLCCKSHSLPRRWRTKCAKSWISEL